MRTFFFLLLLLTLVATTAAGDVVNVSISGQVVINSVKIGPLAGVTASEGILLSFQVDSDDFVDGVPGDTRGYPIDPTSFSLEFSGGLTVGLEDPFPAGTTPYFTLVDGFPVADGFFVSTSPVSPGGVPLETTPYQLNFEVGYGETTLSSLEVLEALGEYDYTDLTRIGFGIWNVVPDNVLMELQFSHMTIEGGPTPAEQVTWGRVKANHRPDAIG